MSKAEDGINDMEKFNEKIYKDGITWLFGHHCLECGYLTFAQHEVKELAKYFYELGYHQAEKGNKLTWEDIVEINKLLIDLGMMFPVKSTPDYYDEVLKRFKNFKERKEK